MRKRSINWDKTIYQDAQKKRKLTLEWIIYFFYFKMASIVL